MKNAPIRKEKHMINNDEYGGFIVSRNILLGKQIRYSFREKSKIKQLNGWNFYSFDDDNEYISNSKNFVILNAKSMLKIAPIIFEIFDAPYGTDLCWIYEQDVHIGFYDLVENKEASIKEIIKK